MDLRDYCNIILIFICTITFSFSQDLQVRCINPKFDQLVDNYLGYSIPAISVADAFESKNDFIFLDAREKEEYNTSHIKNAIHIGYDNFNIDSIQQIIPKDKKLIIYCSIGYRSEKIGEILNQNGYISVQNLYGSIFEWVNQHHQIVDNKGKTTTILHTYNKKWSKWVENDDITKRW
jgi:rhodanese-related sulfurtransferase